MEIECGILFCVGLACVNKQRTYCKHKKIAPVNLENLYEPTQLVDQGKQSFNFTAFHNTPL
jgi:hypothetical protein